MVVPIGGSPPRNASIAAAERSWSSSSGGRTKRRPRVRCDLERAGSGCGPGSGGVAWATAAGSAGLTGGTGATGRGGTGATGGTGAGGAKGATPTRRSARGDASTAAMARAGWGGGAYPDPFPGAAGTKRRAPGRAVVDATGRVRDTAARREVSLRHARVPPPMSPPLRARPRSSPAAGPRRGRSVAAPSKARFSSSANASKASRTSRDMVLRRRVAGIRRRRGRARRGD